MEKINNVLICCGGNDGGVSASVRDYLVRNGYSAKEMASAVDLSWPGVLVVMITPPGANSPNVSAILNRLGPTGVRIVGVWTPASERSHLTAELEMYARAVVCWNPEEVRSAVAGRDGLQDFDCQEKKVKDISRVKCQ